MKIVNNAPAKPPSTTFSDLPATTLLLYNGNLVMKTSTGTAFDVRDGSIYFPPATWIVETVYPDAVLYLHGAPVV